ncbi:MAG: DUF4252 domain-containing protein [Bacteroidota bacterium]
MKTIKFFLTSLIACTFIFTQNCANEKEKESFVQFYKKYNGEDGFISINLPPGLIRLFVDKEDKELKQILKDLDDIRILIYSEKINDGRTSASYLKELDKILSSRDYKDLMVIREGQEVIKFKIRENENKVSELVVVVTDDKEFVALSLSGSIDIEKVKGISKSIDIEGIKQLEELGIE